MSHNGLNLSDLVIRPTESVAIGCSQCPDLRTCGGLSIRASCFSCLDLCKCDDPNACPHICAKKKPEDLHHSLIEVGGWDILDVPRSHKSREVKLPHHIPVIFGAGGRHEIASGKAFAVPLRFLFNGRTGEPRFQSRSELLAAFTLPDKCAIVIDGVSTDQPIENFWGRALDRGIVQKLKQLSPSLVTMPNYSLYANVPRHTDLYNMKRQVLTWAQFAGAGIDAALHLNARSSRDYERLGEFLLYHTEISSVAFEFATGARNDGCRQQHIRELSQLGDATSRRLRLVMRGGIGSIASLRQHFRDIVFLDTDSYHKTRSRQKLMDAKGTTRRTFSLKGQSLSDLFKENARKRALRVEREHKKALLNSVEDTRP